VPLIIDLMMVAHDTRNNRLNLGARIDGMKALCAISEKALLYLDRADRPYDTDALIGVVHKNAALIEEVATGLWDVERIEADGYIVLHMEDVMKSPLRPNDGPRPRTPIWPTSAGRAA
jgi:hypothetical protein